MVQAIRVCLIGFGYAGHGIHAPLIGSVPGLALSTVGSSRPEAVRAALPHVRVIADPMEAAVDTGSDLVVIATPNDLHAPLAEAALRAGKHVVVDKPFTVTLEEARGLARLAEAKGKVLAIFQNRRWDSDFLTVAATLETGRLGTVVQYESRIDRYRPDVRDRWRERPMAGGGLWFDLGPHLVDQALLLFGLPDRVTAQIGRQRAGALTDDWFHVVLSYPGLHAILQAGMLVSGGTARFILHGSIASLVKQEADVQESQLRAGKVPRDLDWGIDLDSAILYDGVTGETDTVTAADGDYCRFYDGICTAILTGAPNPVTPAEGVATMAVLIAAQNSAREGRSLPLPLTGEEAAAFTLARSAWREREAGHPTGSAAPALF